jgi:hypothetical protein
VGGILGRYARRLESRRADLKRSSRGEQEVSDLLSAERSKLWPRLLEELEAAQPFAARALGRQLVAADLQLAAGMVDAGELPVSAAAKLLPATCPRPG